MHTPVFYTCSCMQLRSKYTRVQTLELGRFIKQTCPTYDNYPKAWYLLLGNDNFYRKKSYNGWYSMHNSFLIRKCSVDYRSVHRYNKSFCMRACLYDRIRCQKDILYLRVERCRILNFLFQIRGIDIFQLSYSSIGIFFPGKLLWWHFHLIISHYFT